MGTQPCPPVWVLFCGCFSATTAELGSCGRAWVVHKTENIFFLAFYRRSLLIPVTEPWMQVEEFDSLCIRQRTRVHYDQCCFQGRWQFVGYRFAGERERQGDAIVARETMQVTSNGVSTPKEGRWQRWQTHSFIKASLLRAFCGLGTVLRAERYKVEMPELGSSLGMGNELCVHLLRML